jgi:hypothetical protein
MTFGYRNLEGKLLSEDPRDEDAAPTWSRRRYLEMDARFRGAMLDAIEAGLERMPEAPPPRASKQQRSVSSRLRTAAGSAVGRPAASFGDELKDKHVQPVPGLL